MFTRYATHGTLVHSEIEAVLQPLCTYYTFQTEICPTTRRRHVQGYVCLKQRMRLVTFVRKFPSHVERRNGTHSQAVSYCQKEETRDPEQNIVTYGEEPVSEQGARGDIASFRDAILSGASNWVLLEQYPGLMAKYPKFLHMVRHEQLSFNVLRDLPIFEPRIGWQWSLAQLLGGVPSKRSVIWRWDSRGNAGKSYFAMHYEPRETFVVTGGKFADIHFAYGFQRVVIFDWPRCNEGTFPYGLVEQFKNGYFLSTKYESTAKRFAVPHVVVFANFAPDVSQMSLDRWDIFEITE